MTPDQRARLSAFRDELLRDEGRVEERRALGAVMRGREESELTFLVSLDVHLERIAAHLAHYSIEAAASDVDQVRAVIDTFRDDRWRAVEALSAVLARLGDAAT